MATLGKTSGRDWGIIIFWLIILLVLGFTLYEFFIGAAKLNVLVFLGMIILVFFTVFKLVTGRTPNDFLSIFIAIGIVAGAIFLFIKVPGLLPFSIQQGPLLELKSFVGLP